MARYLFGTPYRQLEDSTIGLNSLVPRRPSSDHSGLRRRILDLDLPLHGELRASEPICIAMDSTGMGVHRSEYETLC